MKKECKKLVKKAREQGWRVEQGTKHMHLYPSDGGRMIPIAHDPTKQGLRNKISQLKRAGLDVS